MVVSGLQFCSYDKDEELSPDDRIRRLLLHFGLHARAKTTRAICSDEIAPTSVTSSNIAIKLACFTVAQARSRRNRGVRRTRLYGTGTVAANPARPAYLCGRAVYVSAAALPMLVIHSAATRMVPNPGVTKRTLGMPDCEAAD